MKLMVGALLDYQIGCMLIKSHREQWNMVFTMPPPN